MKLGSLQQLATEPLANSSAESRESWHKQFPLSTCGRYIMNVWGERFRLKGVNWYGASDVHHVVGGLDVQSLDVICQTVHDLGFNVVRLPFSNEMLRSQVPAGIIDYEKNPTLQGLSALEVYDEVVRCLGQSHVAVIVNNHTTYGEFCGPPGKNSLWFEPKGPFTEAQWMSDWVMIAERYSKCPHVVGLDLRNEIRPTRSRQPSWKGGSCKRAWYQQRRSSFSVSPPSSPVSSRTRGFSARPWYHATTAASAQSSPLHSEPGRGASRSSAESSPLHSEPARGALNWARAALAVAEKIQEVGSQALIIVERIVWPQRPLDAYAACPGPLLPALRGRLVLGVHLYSWSGPGRFMPDWSVPPKWKRALRLLRAAGIINRQNYGHMSPEQLREQMQREFGHILESDTCPVWVSEFGANTSNQDMAWLRDIIIILEDMDADWAYWPLNVGPKPGCGSDEAYGMLSPTWTRRPAGDCRLRLLSRLGLIDNSEPKADQTPLLSREELDVTESEVRRTLPNMPLSIVE